MEDQRSATSTVKRALRQLLWTGAVVCLGATVTLQVTLPARQVAFAAPTSSQPLALSGNGGLLAVANPDNDSVTFFDTSGARPERIDEVPVGREPNGVALTPDGNEAYVANTLDGTVTVLKITGNGRKVKVHKVLQVGTEPYGVAVTPNGRKVYVTNARSNSVS